MNQYLDASELEKIKIPPGLKLGQRVWVDSVFGVTYGDFVPGSEILTERPEDAPQLREIPELVVSHG